MQYSTTTDNRPMEDQAPPGQQTPLLRKGFSIHENNAHWYSEDTPLLENEHSPEPTSGFDDSWQLLKRRATYYVPVLSWLPSYSVNGMVHDIIAGITVAFLLVPQSLSYASALAKIDPIYGLYVAFVPGVIYSILGTSRQLSVGPEALISMLVGTAISQQRADMLHDFETVTDPAVYALLLGAFVGIFLLVLGLMRMGFLDSILSRALLRGFICAVACVIVIEQAIACLGLTRLPDAPGHSASTIEKFGYIVAHISDSHGLTAAVSVGSIIFLVGGSIAKSRMAKYAKAFQLVPEILLAVVFASVLCYAFSWDKQGLEILGEIEGGKFPWPRKPVMPPFAHIQKLVGSAILIAVIGFVESIVITKQYAATHNYPVSPNRELVALGMANIIGSLFLAYPAFGSLARSKINDSAGARTQFSVFVTSICVLLVIMFLLPLFHYVPKPVLASIICVAAVSLLHEAPADLCFMWEMRAWTDLFLLTLTFVTTLAVSVEVGTLLAITLSLVLVVKNTTVPRITILGRIRGTADEYQSLRDYPNQAEHISGILIIKIEEGLHFANTGQLKDRLRRVELFGDFSVHPSEEARLPPAANIIFDVASMPRADCSAVQILMEIIQQYHARHIYVAFVQLREDIKSSFAKAGIMDLVGEENVFGTISCAIRQIELGGNLPYSPCDNP